MWHWQERFDPADVEDAYRRQILDIRRPKSFSHWLKEKFLRHGKYSDSHEAIEGNDQKKQTVIDEAFRKWLHQKCKQENGKREKKNVQVLQIPPRKPPSLHVNPKTKCTRKTKRVEHSVATNKKPFQRRGHSEAANQQAYEAWLARVRREDHIRRAMRREELDRLEVQQRENHKQTWRKKLAVCAYSTSAES